MKIKRIRKFVSLEGIVAISVLIVVFTIFGLSIRDMLPSISQ